MTVTEALKSIHAAPRDAAPFHALLACGFAPLHLKTLFHAHLQRRLPGRFVSISAGLYGDLAGTLERAREDPSASIAVAMEWPDLDPRLGYRSAASWRLAWDDITGTVESSLERIQRALAGFSPATRVALSPPGISLPPMFQTAGWQASRCEVQLDRLLASFLASLSGRPETVLVSSRRLAENSPVSGRFDLKSDLLLGFPYSALHADQLAGTLSQLLAPSAPKKGIITDLDATLWNGIAGEVGAEGVSWDLNEHSQLHALYQNLLSSLAEQGVLVGVASKNDPRVVTQCFARQDILLRPERVFPFEVHWQAKSSSVDRILRTWNIHADSVIFVDDSPLELAEVAAAHPGIHCIRFPGGDYAGGEQMLREIKDLCARENVSQEDLIRADSIRRSAGFREAVGDGSASDTFLDQVEATVSFNFQPDPADRRTLDLVNKTNQFNLNGVRRTDADWLKLTEEPNHFEAVISYEDRFGPLGKVSVIQGALREGEIHVETWVMSCRAFSRRIEHQILRVLFERFDASVIVFDFSPTDRNGPLQDFLKAMLEQKPDGAVCLTRDQFGLRSPRLRHRVAGDIEIEKMVNG